MIAGITNHYFDICLSNMHKYFYTIFLSLLTLQGLSQLCQGSLGDPIVNINFGAGSNPGAPLAAAATGYIYQTADCPNDGFYTVRNITGQCFGNTWHVLNQDHTGNGNGYFMLVNASVQPSTFYIDTVRGLCGNITFEFAAWIMNMVLPTACGNNSNQPNITFTIEKTDGTILQSYNSGNISTTDIPLWRQYGFFFTTPAGVADIVLRMVNNAPGGCGNDLALDDITFRPCGPQIIPTVTGQSSNTINICKDSVRSFTFNCDVSGGFLNPVYQWQERFNNGPWMNIPGANATSFTSNFSASNNTGLYEYRLTIAENGNQGSAQCTISSLPFKINVNANPLATASNDGPVCKGSNISLTANGGNQYSWTGPGNFSATGNQTGINNIQYSQAGIYTVTATNAAGCSSTGTTSIVVNPKPIAGTSFTDTSICIKGSAPLLAMGGSFYDWSPAVGLSSVNIANPTASPEVNTQYRVVVANNFLCMDTAYLKINLINNAIARAGPDKSTAPGIAVTLSGSIEEPYARFFWSPPTYINNPRSLTPQVMPVVDAAYVLTVESLKGCSVSTDTVWVKVSKEIFIPNAFSPNGDGINDTWNIPALNAYPDFVLNVYNRYGEIVFNNRYPPTPWKGFYKGNPLPIGAYPYYIHLGVGNPVFKGTVMIIR
jgi:gliding motility-associated-like protein